MAVFGYYLLRCEKCGETLGPVGIELGEGLAVRRAAVQTEISESCPGHLYGDWHVPLYTGGGDPGRWLSHFGLGRPLTEE